MSKAETIETKEATPEEVAAKRAALLAELADLPVTIPAGTEPGTRVGEGVGSDYVPYSEKWFTDVESRRKDIGEDGKPKWPNYDLHTVIAPRTESIRVNGVGFMVIAGQECKLPSPHYNVYKEALDAPRKLMEIYAPDPNPQLRPGYVSKPFYMGPGFLKKESE